MSKRSIVEIVSTLSEELHGLSTEEATAMTKLLKAKTPFLYQNFITALKNSRYGPFMIEGDIGKAFQEYYKLFYANLIIPEFAQHFKHMYQVTVANLDNNDKKLMNINVFMCDIFDHIYNLFLTNTCFLGHFLTHTNTLAALEGSRIYVVKYNNRSNNTNKRLLIEYACLKDETVRHGTVGIDVRKPSVIARTLYDDTIEVLSVVSTKNKTLVLGFNNDLYEKEQVSRTLYQQESVKMIFDDNTTLVDYSTRKDFLIKGIYANRESFFILTMSGKVYIRGRCLHAAGADALERIDRMNVIMPFENDVYENIGGLKVYRFIPVKLPKEAAPIVYIYPQGSVEMTYLVDANNRVFQYDWVHPTDGFVFADEQIDRDCPLFIKRKAPDTESIIIDVSDHISLTEDKIFIDNWTNSEKPVYGGGDDYREFKRKENRILQFTSYAAYSIVLLSNQKIYIFNQANFPMTSYVLRKVIKNEPIKWDKKNASKNDTWTFQCEHCRAFDVSLSVDHSLDAVLCSEECQNALWLNAYPGILSIVNK